MSPAPSDSLGPRAREALRIVLDLLSREQASVSSIVDKRAWRVHVDDSLTGLEIGALREASKIADIGSGAGFPGLVLAVSIPSAQVDLIESVGRKCDFIGRAIERAGITNARVLNARSEELAGGEGREAYDVVTARAVGRLSTLAELASPLLVHEGALVAWKGKRDADEEGQMQRASESLSMTPEQVLDVGGEMAGSEHRHLHVIRKTGATPPNLPRRPGIAKKRPLG